MAFTGVAIAVAETSSPKYWTLFWLENTCKQKNGGGEQKNDGAGGERKSKNKSVVWGKEYYNTLTGEMRSVENETGDAPQWSPWAEGVREFQHRDWVDE